MPGTKPHFGTILNDCLGTVSATQLVNPPTPLKRFETELNLRKVKNHWIYYCSTFRRLMTIKVTSPA